MSKIKKWQRVANQFEQEFNNFFRGGFQKTKTSVLAAIWFAKKGYNYALIDNPNYFAGYLMTEFANAIITGPKSWRAFFEWLPKCRKSIGKGGRHTIRDIINEVIAHIS